MKCLNAKYFVSNLDVIFMILFCVFPVHLGVLRRPGKSSPAESLPSFASVENLLLDMTNQESLSPQEILIVHDPDVTILPRSDSTKSVTHEPRPRRRLSRSVSSASMQGPRRETSFGTDNGAPQTTIYMGGGDPTQAGYMCTQRGSTQVRSRSSTGLSVSTNPYNLAISADNVSRYMDDDDEDDDVFAEATNPQKCPSMNNVNDVPPPPENLLTQHSTSNATSWSSVYTTAAQPEPPAEPKPRTKFFSGAPDRSCMCPSPQNPPPYIPPPSYHRAVGVARQSDTSTFSELRGRHQSEPVNTSFSQQRLSTGSDITEPEPLSQADPPTHYHMAESYCQAVETYGSTPVGRSLFSNIQRRRTIRRVSGPANTGN